MTPQLKIATEDLYESFSKYPFKSSIEGCPCCVSNADKSTLHSKQLRDLEDEDISRYAFKAMTTWGDLDDFKHYLPRIFELAATRNLIVDTFVVLGKLEFGEWKTWPKEEQESIHRFLMAWWKFDINFFKDFDPEILIELHKRIQNLPSILSEWRLNLDSVGFMNYVHFIERHYHEVNNHLLRRWLERRPRRGPKT